MKLLTFLLSLILLSCSSLQAGAIEVVTDVDLERYMGDWHQVALIPNSFQKQCVTNTMANYKLLPANKKGVNYVQVTNSCTKNNGQYNEGVGRARVNPKLNSNAKLQVTFAIIFGRPLWFASGNYWIMDLGENYEYVVVGEPKRKLGWILARTKTLPNDKLNEIQDLLTSQGYNPCNFMMSNNSEQEIVMPTSLCEFTE